ncbi:MAG: TolC family outer membrane protein [Rhodobacterales bacterium]|jgi:outer membrane protein|nr:TolC family outer membrane protein [Rhodobacterales bacterium]MDB3882366.1 TolC family outer membrane protein [Amylibacter sp.]MBT4323968.1 TolC family outer membrane protein [Rhodobacterales bacterium]MBT6833005.1 TolC family outer membrane protein [Rhodobacterales bacterium]MDC0333913.1 TolC family outer membrane protein [Amylibacter sp.]
MFRFFSSSAIIILFAFPVSAKETNLKSTLEATYNNNFLIAQQREKILKYNESVTQQLSVKKPDLSANLSQNLDESNGKYNNSANITIKQLLYDGGQSSNLVDAAKYTVLAERELLIKAEQDNLLKAITVYMDLRQAQANLELAENNIKVIEEQLRAANNRFEVGEVTRTDVSQTKARLALAVSNVETRKAILTGKSASYLLVVGENHGNLSTPPKHPEIPNTFSKAEKIAIENHPRILAARLQLKVSEYRIDASRGIFNPTIIGSITSKTGTSISSSTGATIQATIPLFNSGNLRSKKRAAINDKKISKHALDIALLTTRSNLQIYHSSWLAAVAAIKASKAQIEASQIAFEGMREESKLGSRTTLDVLDAEQELLSARSNLVTALRDEQVQAYNVLSEMGQLTTSNLGLEVQTFNSFSNNNKIEQTSPLGKARIRILEKLKNR